MFEEDVDRRILHFLVGTDVDKRFLIVRYRIVDTFGRIYRSFHVGENLFSFASISSTLMSPTMIIPCKSVRYHFA